MAVEKAGILHLCLQVQVAIGFLLLALSFAGQGFLLDFIQVPGGLLDVAAGQEAETHVRATILHMGYLAIATTVLVKWHEPRRGLDLVHVAGAVLTMPFGLVLAIMTWKTEPAASGAIGGKMRFLIGFAWAAQAIVVGALAFAAFIGILAGAAFWGMAALLAALAVQYGTLRTVVAIQAKTTLHTYGSPIPDLPTWGENP